MSPIKDVRRTDAIYASVFYPRKAWPALIRRAVMPFIALGKERYDLLYACGFSVSRGEAINFTFLVKGDKKEFALFFHEFFQRYLDDRPATVVRGYEEYSSVFMDFPVNSLRYGLHDLPFFGRKTFNEDLFLALQEASAIFLNALQKNSRMDIMLLALQIYAYIGIYGQVFSDRSITVEASPTNPSPLEKLLEIQYKENEDLIKEVISDNYRIISTNKSKTGQEWLVRWSVIYKGIAEGTRKRAWADFNACIVKQLGLAVDEELLVRYFVKKAKEESTHHFKAVRYE